MIDEVIKWINVMAVFAASSSSCTRPVPTIMFHLEYNQTFITRFVDIAIKVHSQ
jgi:hypothetical protein